MAERAAEESGAYYLSSEIYLGIHEDCILLVDLFKDQYLTFPRGDFNLLGGKLKGWPCKGEDTPPAGSRSVEDVLQELQAAGILTTDPSVGKEACIVAFPQPRKELAPGSLELRPKVMICHFWRFLWATSKIRIELRYKPFMAIIDRVRKRKNHRAAVGAPCDLSRARDPVEVYLYLRPLFFGARNVCLHDSLALIEYLSYYNLFPTLMLGLQVEPLVAHCWVQEGDTAFNDVPEHIEQFVAVLGV